MIIIEITSPWEENFQKSHGYKVGKYNQLKIDLEDGKYFGVKWTVELICVEVGARGAIHQEMWGRMCKKLGIFGKVRKNLRNAVQEAAIHCSHYIFLCRFHKHWEPQPLLDTWRRSRK